MTVLNRKLRRELVQSKGMLAAIVAITAVGTGCFVGMLSTYNNLQAARADYYSRCRMADFWIDLKKAPLADVERLIEVEGVSEIRPRISFPVIVDLDDVDKPISGQVISLPADPAPVLNGIVLERGSYFTAERRNEVIVTEKFARMRRLRPGTFMHLIINGQRKRLFVVGTAITSEYMYMTPPGSIAPAPADYGVFYIKREYAEEVFDFHGACNSVVGLLQPSVRDHPMPVLKVMSQRLDSYGVFTSTPRSQQMSNLALSSELGGLRVMAVMLPVIFLGVAALVLNVLMTRMAEQQRTIVGTLKALGYSNARIFAHFVQFGLVVGVLGGMCGCGLGHWISGRMVILYRQFFEFPRLANEIYPGIMGLAILISVVFSVVGTLRGVREVARLNPAEAMHPRPPATGGKILLERWRGLWTRLDFRWQTVLRSLFRNKVRSLIGLFAAAMGAALVLVAFGNTDSLNDMVVFQFDKVLLSDYDLTLKDEADAGALAEAKRLPGVVHAEPVLNVACTFYRGNHSKKGTLTGIVPNARLTIPRDAAGRPVRVPPVGLLMVQRMADQLRVKEGDLVRFVPIKGLRRAHDVPVAKIINSTFGLSVYADYGYLNRLVGEVSAISKLQLKTRQTRGEKRAFLREIKRYPSLESVAIIPEQRESMMSDFVAKMKGISVVMILFAAVIFFGSILNSSLIALAERRREIATFRVLGYQPMQVGEIFLRENMLVNIAGALLGLPLGYGILYIMSRQYANDMFSMPCVINPISWLWTVVLAVAFVIAAHLIVQRCINRLNWPEALAMKE
ncbi:MAG: FtsX-like permease family protein [Planctomycetes bacterium]|nr:FtsX-like permease family protein [Planctomycetota bacterium]